MERDPRYDPRAGDLVEKGDKRRFVTERCSNDIFYRSSTRNGWGVERQCWISTWVDWCRDATASVAHIGSPGPSDPAAPTTDANDDAP